MAFVLRATAWSFGQRCTTVANPEDTHSRWADEILKRNVKRPRSYGLFPFLEST